MTSDHNKSQEKRGVIIRATTDYEQGYLKYIGAFAAAIAYSTRRTAIHESDASDLLDV